MKKVIYCLFLLQIVGCTAIKNLKKVKIVSNEQQVFSDSISLVKAYKTYTLKIPKYWYSYKEVHGHIMHSPKVIRDRNKNYYINNFLAIEYTSKGCKASSLQMFLECFDKQQEQNFTNYNYILKKLHHEKYGEYYVVKQGSFFGGEKWPVTTINILYHYKNRNFRLSYTSENKYYEEFIKDVEGIISSFTIKDTN